MKRKNGQIILTPEELDEIKDEAQDEAKFRTKVLMQLKALSGIPDKVTTLTVHSNIHWTLLILLVSGIVGLAWRVLGR